MPIRRGIRFSFVRRSHQLSKGLAAILSRRCFGVLERIGRSNLTVDQLRSFGLFRWTIEKRLECAFILLVVVMRKLPRKVGEDYNFDDHITRSVLAWQRFEHFVAFYRRVKSIVFHETPLNLSTFHAGARFGSIDGILINESTSRTVVETIHQQDAKSNSEGSAFLTIPEDGGMNSIVINGCNLYMRVQLRVDSQQVQCNEVIQCKLLETEETINEITHTKLRTRAVNENADVFLLIVPAQSAEIALPARCGVVSIKEFDQYFGPFASRAFRSFLEPPNVNTASFHELRRIEGVGDAYAKKIIAVRKNRAFTSLEDATSRLVSNKNRKIADILSAVRCEDSGPDHFLSSLTKFFFQMSPLRKTLKKSFSSNKNSEQIKKI